MRSPTAVVVTPLEKVVPPDVIPVETVGVCGDYLHMLDRLYVEDWERKNNVRKGTSAGSYWLRRQVWFNPDVPLPDVRELSFELRLRNMVTGDVEKVTLQDCAIPSGTRIPCAIYELSIFESGPVLEDFIYLDLRVPGDSPIDLTRLAPLSFAEADLIANPAPPIAEEPPAPTFKRTTRAQGDVASRIGVTIGRRDGDVVLPLMRAWHVFNLPQATIVGKVTATVEVSDPRRAPIVDLALFDAFGVQVLSTQLRGPNGMFSSEFDEIRLDAGDYVLAFFSPADRAAGSYTNPRSGLYPDSRRPMLDELLTQPAVTDQMGNEIPVGQPEFRFTAR